MRNSGFTECRATFSKAPCSGQTFYFFCVKIRFFRAKDPFMVIKQSENEARRKICTDGIRGNTAVQAQHVSWERAPEHFTSPLRRPLLAIIGHLLATGSDPRHQQLALVPLVPKREVKNVSLQCHFLSLKLNAQHHSAPDPALHVKHARQQHEASIFISNHE